MKKTIIFGSIALLLFCGMMSTLLFFLVFSNTDRILNTYQMDGASMEPTYSDGDTFTIETEFVSIQRGDVVVIEKNGASYVKRVIGLPGEKLELLNYKVYIDDSLLTEPYLEADTITVPAPGEPITFQLSSNQYFVMGDNRIISLDSRHSNFGLISIEEIVGVVGN